MKKVCHLALAVLLLSVSFSSIRAEDIRIVCPYVGPISDTYQNNDRNLELKDHSLLKGVFFQWVNTNRYQWNAFLYQSSEINYSTLWGGHFFFDYYLNATKQGKFVIGAGTEYLLIDMDAQNHISPLSDFKMKNNILVPYLRFGYRFQINSANVKTAVLPWLGGEHQRVWGDLSTTMDPPGPAPATTTTATIKDNSNYGMAGLNFTATIFHMLGVEAKYYGSFNSDDYFSTFNGMINVFLTRHVGVSYRFKYMEMTVGSHYYNIFGLAVMF